MNAAKPARRPSVRVGAAALLAGMLLIHPSLSYAGGASQTAAGEVSLDPECLTITQSSAATYMIENTGCAARSVLASIELSTARADARCFTKKIRTQISIASDSSVPVVNYQCVEGAPDCSMETLRAMFPECHAG